MADPLLDVRDLRVRFDTDEGVVRAVDGVDFDVGEGETVCLVGESGSGKTVACESITRLLPDSAAVDGEIRFDGTDLTDCSVSELESYRGGRIGHVFQNPQDALDPVYTVGEQVVEAIRIHRDVSKAAAREEAVALLDRVGIGEAAARFDDYPHQFSGGMKQRVVVAMALAADPDLLIADEPTTALDVTIQRQVLNLLADLQAERGMALLFVTHDLGVVAEIADRVVVTYAGKVMETAGVHDLFDDPAHPYTRALLACLPGRGAALETIGGSIPEPTDPPDGCRFHPRCPHAVDDCIGGNQPAFRAVDGGRADTDSGGQGGPEGDTDAGATDHGVACLLYGEDHALPPELGVSDD
ncbi:ABC transporter ATP-binding protein [Halosimplex halophilum]|uniref:ABC transporter ATP-binding protein n=1 Tax=Halosimplex halophilum TaxID=2559572 RepID=UPI00107F4B9E|nr:ABC transporter ATP-binding protein [Halosimplex halophilum]